MLDALQIAATGMQAQQLHVDTIANNIANLETAGFKRVRISFHDLVTRLADTSMSGNSWSRDDPFASPARPGSGAGHSAGVGVGVATVLRHFDPGEIRQTGSPLDLAIAGDGFVEVTLPDGGHAYSRGGTLRINEDGLLALRSGQALSGAISVPDDAQALVIESDGRVRARMAGSSQAVELGQIGLVRFSVPSALASLGPGLYQATEASGNAVVGHPGEGALGSFRQAALEASNVRMVDEMVALLVAQRAYEASVNVAKAADEMLGVVNGMRK